MDHRLAPRVRIARMILICVGNQRIASAVLDASVRGLSVVSATARRPGEILRIEWPLTGGHWRDAEVKVVRAAQRPDGQCVIGLEFLRMAPELQRELALRVTGARQAMPTARPKTKQRPVQIDGAPITDLPPNLEALLPRNARELNALYQLALADTAGVISKARAR